VTLVDEHECLDCGHHFTPADERPDDDWDSIPLAELAAAIRNGTHEPTLPTVLAVVGALALFYRARINALFGESGGGKSWLALATIAEVVRNGGWALMADYEDNPVGIAERLVLLGLTDDEIARVDYRNPVTGIGKGAGILEAEARTYDLVVIDSTGEAMAAGGVDSNNDGEVAQWFKLAKMMSRLPGGPAVLVLDHIPKDKEAPSSYAIGSQRKRAAVTGAAYRVDTIKEPAKGRNGKLKLTVAKDRPGNRPKGSTAAEVAVVSDHGAVRIELHISDAQAAAEAGEKFRPTTLMERVSRYLEQMAGTWVSARDVSRNCQGKTDGLRLALECLVEDGFVEQTGHGYATLLAFRAPVDNATAPPRPNRAPSAPQGAAETPQSARAPRAPDIPKSGARGAGRGVSGGGTGDTPRPPVDNPAPDPFEEELF
jgi:hypothetical protein